MNILKLLLVLAHIWGVHILYTSCHTFIPVNMKIGKVSLVVQFWLVYQKIIHHDVSCICHYVFYNMPEPEA